MATQAEARKGAELMNRGVVASGDTSRPQAREEPSWTTSGARPSGNFTSAP
jgi:hypothetical protein